MIEKLLCVPMDIAFDEVNHMSFVSTTCSVDDVVKHAMVSIAFTQHFLQVVVQSC